MKKTALALWSHLMLRADLADPVRLVVLGYASYCLFGWMILGLPWCRVEASGAGALDHLFTVVSAVSTTGLVTVSTSDTYTGPGEAVVLALIQVGGLGYMTLGSVLMMAISGRMTPLRERIGAAAMSLPPGFRVGSFLRLVVLYTFVVEAAGAILLHRFVFAPAGLPDAWWQSIFHSVSSFCTAGFGLFNTSLEGFGGHTGLNAIVSVLSLLGAIGFVVVQDLWHSLRSRSVHATLTTRIILASTTCILILGTVLFAWEEPAVRTLAPGERWMASFFQMMSASTTVGFNTIPIGSLSSASVVLLTVAMLIGASPAGTGGGMKTTTFSALWAVMMSVVRRRDRTTFFGRAIPEGRVQIAVASMLFYVVTLVAGMYALSLVEVAPLPDIAFEAASALGTVGLSRGITGGLTAWGKSIVIVLMFIGRAGPLVLGLATLAPSARRETQAREEDVVV